MRSQVATTTGRLEYNLGIETLGDVFTTVIGTGTPIPCEHREIFSTAADNQSEIEVHVLQGTSQRASKNTSLGKFKLTRLPKAPRGVPQIEVTFRVQPNSEFALIARDLGTQAEVHVVRVG